LPTTLELRQGVDGITAEASRELAPVWGAGLALYDLRALLNELLPGLIDEYGLAASAYAADWYDEYRVEQDVPGRFVARPQPVRDPGVQQLVAWATKPLEQDVPDLSRARVQLDGGVQLRLSNVARETVAESSYDDPQAVGWQRVGAGACAFCRMLIARGAVYSERSARFAAHDHCHCSAVPAFGGGELPVTPYVPNKRRVSDADRARVRAYLRANPDA
jgi:hypothetical protein